MQEIITPIVAHGCEAWTEEMLGVSWKCLAQLERMMDDRCIGFNHELRYLYKDGSIVDYIRYNI